MKRLAPATHAAVVAIHFGCFDAIGSVITDRPVNVFFEDRFGLDRLELGLEVG